ncbi:hypothetical protein LCGC14_1306430 [marine sediment metagenome]|uniref:Uncharacterized protein n=1 Tax=marine sediment metagenome TaxID=412755 RepID=A0A0F9L8E6_9ZZZZ
MLPKLFGFFSKPKNDVRTQLNLIRTNLFNGTVEVASNLGLIKDKKQLEEFASRLASFINALTGAEHEGVALPVGFDWRADWDSSKAVDATEAMLTVPGLLAHAVSKKFSYKETVDFVLAHFNDSEKLLQLLRKEREAG